MTARSEGAGPEVSGLGVYDSTKSVCGLSLSSSAVIAWPFVRVFTFLCALGEDFLSCIISMQIPDAFSKSLFLLLGLSFGKQKVKVFIHLLAFN